MLYTIPSPIIPSNPLLSSHLQYPLLSHLFSSHLPCPSIPSPLLPSSPISCPSHLLSSDLLHPLGHPIGVTVEDVINGRSLNPEMARRIITNSAMRSTGKLHHIFFSYLLVSSYFKYYRAPPLFFILSSIAYALLFCLAVTLSQGGFDFVTYLISVCLFVFTSLLLSLTLQMSVCLFVSLSLSIYLSGYL